MREVSRLPKLCIDALLSAVGCDAHQAAAHRPCRGRAADLKLPFPQLGFDLLKAEYDAPAAHLHGATSAP